MIRRLFLKEFFLLAGALSLPSMRSRMKSPFDIRLRATAGPSLTAHLINVSPKSQIALHDLDLQPSEPRLIDEKGAAIHFVDRRQLKKYDTTPYRYLYKSLAVREEFPLLERKFEPQNGAYHFEWGPFGVDGLAPGAYRAKIIWKSALDSWVDSETGNTGKWRDIWLGEIHSNEVSLQLPAINSPG